MAPCRSPPRACAWRGQGGLLSGETALEDLQLVPHGAGQLVAELLEPLGDLRDLRAPLLGLDREGLADLVGGHVEARDVERVRRGHVADRGLLGGGGALEALD